MTEKQTQSGLEKQQGVDAAFPGILVSIGWVVLFFVLQLVAGFIAIAAAVALDGNGRDPLTLATDLSFVAGPTILSLIAAGLILVGLLWLYLRTHDRIARIGLTRWSKLSLMQTTGLAVALIGLGLGFNYLYATYVIPDVKSQEQMLKLFAALPKTAWNQAMLFVAVAILAPVLEELLFRGLLQTSLAKRMPIWAAILLASAIFALIHFQPYAFPALMAMGIVFGVLYHLTGSLRVTILAHALNNSAALLLTAST
ncbi:MAG: lysostaphin resistance A-like protein [Sphingorhabdus sp.]